LRGLLLIRLQIFSTFPHVLLTSVPGSFQYLQPFVFRHHPILPVLTTNTHSAEDWRGDSKSRGAQLNILDFGGIHAALQRGGDGRRRHFLLEKVFESKVSMHDVSILSTAFACNKALYIGREICLRIGYDSINGLMRTSISYNWAQGVWRR
jgi:hypothetical protein